MRFRQPEIPNIMLILHCLSIHFIDIMPILTIISPCYNEQGVLIHAIPVILQELQKLKSEKHIAEQSHILLIDDGSQDDTWAEIIQLSEQYPTEIKALKLARNFGHQNALFAGMNYALKSIQSDICITMDCDLQDDPKIMGEMIEQYKQGSDVVYGVRKQRHKDTFFKRFFAESYYAILQRLGVDIVPNHADYRLLSQRMLQQLSAFREYNLFLRGLIPSIGYRSAQVFYEREERVAGYSKYDVARMVRLAVNGVCSFSAAPLLFILWCGILISFVSLIFGVWALFVKFFGGSVPGWASTVVPMYFLGGVQLLTLGVIGIYVGKIFDEVKDRPRYIIEKEL